MYGPKYTYTIDIQGKHHYALCVEKFDKKIYFDVCFWGIILICRFPFMSLTHYVIDQT